MDTAFNLLLVVFNGCLALFTFFLWRVSSAQAGILQRSLDFARASADAAKESADAAKVSAAIAKESLTTLERPYVFIDKLEPLIQANIGNRAGASSNPAVRFTLKNYGRAPAMIREIRVELGLWSARQNPSPSRMTLSYPIVLGANASHHPQECQHQSSIGDGIAQQIRRGEFHFWFTCLIRYDEVSGQTHTTQIRQKYDNATNTFATQDNDDYNINN